AAAFCLKPMQCQCRAAGEAGYEIGETCPRRQYLRQYVSVPIVKALGLQPTGTALVYAAAAGGTPHRRHQFQIEIGIWTGNHTEVNSNPIPVVAADFSAYPFDILIGRDVLNTATVVYDG